MLEDLRPLQAFQQKGKYKTRYRWTKVEMDCVMGFWNTVQTIFKVSFLCL